MIASINELNNLSMFKPMLKRYECEIIVVDEGDGKLRDKNSRLLEELSYRFFGPKEREEWFKQRFGSSYEKYLSVIPVKCHAETSFGFLVAYEEEPDMIIELDDDVFPVEGHDLVDLHWKNLSSNDGITVKSKGKWYNTVENLELNKTNVKLFPRGHPYSHEARAEDYIWVSSTGACVLNMGLWVGHPDLDALTILYHGGLDGLSPIEGTCCKRGKVIVDRGTYFAICSMNTAFLRKIIPAFYQLYMGHMGVDRFDDIWSGIFLKKIADHLGDGICMGKPLIQHRKRPRSIFKDLKSELEGMIINEVLWRIVDSIQLSGNEYYTCYQELTEKLEENLNEFNEKFHRDFIKLQVQKMKIWLNIIDKIE